MSKFKSSSMFFIAALCLVFASGCWCKHKDKIPPTVSSVNPVNLATDVPFNQKITAIFSEAMKSATITTASFTLKKGPMSVTGTVAYTGTTATFTPASDLEPETEYTATITTKAKDLAGNALKNDYVWSFTTGATPDTTAPTITSTNPADNASDVAFDKKIAATFSEAMDPETLTTASFTLEQGTTPVSGTVICVGAIATFSPSVDLDNDTEYTATITTGATDLAGNPLDNDYVWTFRTGSTPDTTRPTIISTNPADNDTSVAINKRIKATFSETMDVLTITTANFIVTGPDNLTIVTGTVEYDAITSVATFIPGSNLAPSTTFTATIKGGSSGVKDLAVPGNALFSDYVWTFTTGTEEAQTILQEPVPLGASSTFAVFASAIAITDAPTSVITGDVGLDKNAGSNITGFSVPSTCPEVDGTIYAFDSSGPACAVVNTTLLADASLATIAASGNAWASGRGTPAAVSGNLNGLTLYPGLYESGTSLEISAGGKLYLDAQGDDSAVFIIRAATSITTLGTSEVVLTKGAKATNVYWVTGTSYVTLGANSIMKGTIIAATAITLETGANLEGRALNQGPAAAAITVNASTITVPLP